MYAGALTKAGIKFTPAVGSVFCWVDLRSALTQPTWKAERQLWEEGFVQRCGFIITPGTSVAHVHDQKAPCVAEITCRCGVMLDGAL